MAIWSVACCEECRQVGLLRLGNSAIGGGFITCVSRHGQFTVDKARSRAAGQPGSVVVAVTSTGRTSEWLRPSSIAPDHYRS